MTDADKAYMNKEMPELHDPDPVEEVFASLKLLIAVLTITITAGLFYYFLYQLTYKLG
jgi:hypothetical protein